MINFCFGVYFRQKQKSSLCLAQNLEYFEMFNRQKIKHARQIAGKKPPLIPIMTIGIERRERKKMTFVEKHF